MRRLDERASYTEACGETKNNRWENRIPVHASLADGGLPTAR